MPSYAALVRPALDRVYNTMRTAGRPYGHRVVDETGLQPGFISSFYFGLLARPMPSAGFAAATTYSGGDMTGELEQGIATVDGDGTWTLSPSGRDLALRWQLAVAEGARDLWSRRAMATMPGLAALPRLGELLGRLLDAGATTGGPAFAAMAPVYLPEDASPEVVTSSRMGALRHHRADAHRAAWQGAGLTLPELLALSDGPKRQAIEDETNRRDAAIYEALSPDERVEFLAILAALPGA